MVGRNSLLIIGVAGILTITACGGEDPTTTRQPTATTATPTVEAPAPTPTPTLFYFVDEVDRDLANFPYPNEIGSIEEYRARKREGSVDSVERISFSDSGEFNLIHQEYGEVTVNLKVGDILRVNFNVSATAPMNPDNPSKFPLPGAGTILTVIDPMGGQMIVEGKGTGQTEEFTFEVNDTFEVVAGIDGEHQIGFFNPFALQFLIIKFEYFVNPS